jgi:hypothetical protein
VVQFNFKYSIQFELFRIAYTFQRLDFYTENNYYYDLPKSVSKDMTTADVLSKLAAEYDDESYQVEAKELEKELVEQAPVIEKMRLVGIINTNAEYDIYLTKYGVGGSFGLPNSVTLKVTDRKSAGQKLATLLHEVIHLHVQEWILEYNLTHWQKERLVDLIGLQYFPELRKAQVIKEDVSIVDQAFEANHPNLQKTIEAIGLQ